MPLRCGSAWSSLSHQREAFLVLPLELAYILLVSFSLKFHKNLTPVLLHTHLIIYYTTFRSTFSHALLGGVISISHPRWRASRSPLPFRPRLETSAGRCGRLPRGSTHRKSSTIPEQRVCSTAFAVCAAQPQSVSRPCHVQAPMPGAPWARICQHPERDDLCTAHHGNVGRTAQAREVFCASSGGVMHETPSTRGTRLLFMGNLLASHAPASSEAPTNTSQVFPTPCRGISYAFMRVCIETLPCREAPIICPLGLIKVKSLWPSLGLLASYSPPSLLIGTNGFHGLLPPQ